MNQYNNEEKLLRTKLNYTRDNGDLDRQIDTLLEMAGDIGRPELIRSLVISALKAGQEDDNTVDLKMMASSMKEMRYTAKAFRPYRGIKKVSVFGSARTKPTETAYKMASTMGQNLARLGYMVITGGGGGIMQAAHEGAGPDSSFGVNIRLPFEQKANPVLEGNQKSITYKYFFTRKVAFVKESDAIALFPGGFGTFDEAMETLTLVQTGKRNPVPIVLMDEPGGVYWLKWIEYVKENLLASGYISRVDMKLFKRTESVDEAVDIINRFYARYHSLRYIGNRLAIRLSSKIDQDSFTELRDGYTDLLSKGGEMFLSGSLPEEDNEPEIKDLQRIILDFNRSDFGRLKEFIDAVNSL